MDLAIIALGIPFIISSSGVVFYCYFTKNQFIMNRINLFIQGVFWLCLGIFSTYNIFHSTITFAYVMNGVLIVLGFIFGFYLVMQGVNDKETYLLPFAKDNNEEFFKKFGKKIGSGKIKISGVRPNRIDNVIFNDVSNEEQREIMKQIGTNPELVMVFGGENLRNKITKNILFTLLVIVVVFFIL